MKTVALVACVKDKLDHPAPAKDLYQDQHFRQWMRDAEDRNASAIYILSGKYGLLLPDDIIAPYDLNLSDQSQTYQSDWNKRVLKRLAELEDLDKVHVLIYTNEVYYRNLLPHFRTYEIPFKII